MSSKKHTRKKGQQHRDHATHGSCKKCGKQLKSEHALIVKGVWYCYNGECQSPEITGYLAANSQAATSVKPSFWCSGLFLQLLVTSILCLLLFCAFAMREIWRLKAENGVLKESRLALIDLFREQNSEMAALLPKKTADTLHDDSSITVDKETPIAPEPVKKRRQRQTVRQYQHSPDYQFNISNGPVGQKLVSFTFDGGGSANATNDILDTLASRSVKATMFLTGNYIRKYHAEVQRIVAEGHECGNHTVNHPHLTTYEANRVQATLPEISAPFIADQLQRAEVLFHSVTGSRFVPLWRAPYGEFNREICRWGYGAGYLHVGWRQGRTWLDGLDSNDWIPDSTVAGYRSPDEFLDKITRIASLPPPGLNGGIILMHLGTSRKEPYTQTHRILGALIDTLHTKGFSIVPVSEMVKATGIDLASLRGRSDIQ